jgi:hypothetical protein
MGFAKEAVEAVGGDWEFASLVNSHLAAAGSKRIKSVRREGDLARSIVAWKIATLEQALRYRLCALAEGATSLLNQHNSVSAIVLARAVVETTALIIDFERKFKRHLVAREGIVRLARVRGLWQGLRYEHDVQPVPRLPLSR